MRLKSSIALFLLILPAAAYADIFDCSQTAPRRVAAPAAGISRVEIIGRAGSLRVTGRTGAADIVATGTACASDKGDLDGIQLRSERNGSSLRIEAYIPDRRSFFGFDQARLDFEVTLPASLEVSVTDGSGSTRIFTVGPLTVVDGSGELEIRGVRGNLKVRDGSGSLDIADVSGDVDVRDGSGSVEIRKVGGSVIVTDGSGSIDVSDILGGFEVRDDGSGGVEYDRVGGQVRIPRDNRHRH